MMRCSRLWHIEYDQNLEIGDTLLRISHNSFFRVVAWHGLDWAIAPSFVGVVVKFVDCKYV